jgi:hypothetical protein
MTEMLCRQPPGRILAVGQDFQLGGYAAHLILARFVQFPKLRVENRVFLKHGESPQPTHWANTLVALRLQDTTG